MRSKIKPIVEVVKVILQQQRTAKQSGSLTFPSPKRRVLQSLRSFRRKGISERISERTSEHSADVPVPQVARQAIQVQKI